jgi:hypothetical protein
VVLLYLCRKDIMCADAGHHSQLKLKRTVVSIDIPQYRIPLAFKTVVVIHVPFKFQ